MSTLFKKYSIYILSINIIVFTTISLIVYSYYLSLTKVIKDYHSINLQKTDNLMIVSHPNDEIIFGGAHLLNDNYLVVCITCGEDSKITREFVEVMQKTNDQYIILGYPEYARDERENWDNYLLDMKYNLETIVGLKKWDTIVTHNPEGEYGSLQHKLVSMVVTKIAPKNNLYYFGKYHTKKTIVNYYDKLTQMNKNTLNQKIKLIGIYKTEKYIQTEFSHIYNYEEWLKYTEWSE